MVALFALLAALFLAGNIGANNAATSMAPAFGAGLWSRRRTLAIYAVAVVFGATIASHAVIRTLGTELVGGAIYEKPYLLPVVLAVAGLCLLAANLLGLPVSTTHASVASIIGVGAAVGSVREEAVLRILVWWAVTPFAALAASYLLGRLLYTRLLLSLYRLRGRNGSRKAFGAIITVTGAYVAFAAGANTAANSVGALVGGGLLASREAAWIAGLAMAGGGLLFGGRVLDTLAKKVTRISLARAVVVEVVSGTVVLVSALSGVPISLTAVVTFSILGLRLARTAAAPDTEKAVPRILVAWAASPSAAFLLVYGLIALAR
mgnify:FL=1